ncbi:MAG: PP2C family protein-serine/threonine phosphatase, partial [Pirellulaceae bacterium]
GMNAGDVASKLAIDATTRFLLNSMHWLFDPRQPEVERFVEDLKEAALFTHGIVRKDAETVPHHTGMGTTLTLACIIWPMLYVMHVGDSRCYVMHKNDLVLLTRDQTFAQYLLDSGALSSEQFKSSPLKHVLISAIGGSDQPTAAVYQQPLDNVDRLLLCSDGVTGHWSDEELKELLRSNKSPNEICDEIVRVANERGGHDNITVITARFVDSGA